MSDKPQMGLDLGLPEVADNLKVPKKTIKTGTSGVSQATLVTTPERMSSPPHGMAELQQISAVGPDLSVADMAKLLDADPNYRVIQRLVPALHFRPVAQIKPGNVQRVAVLDTETTGLSAATDVIVELALVVMDIDTSTGLPVGDVLVFDGFQDPGRAIPKEVQLLTGISNEMVAGQALDEAAISKIMEGVQWVVAHNAAFDRPFVEQRLPYFADLAWACSFADIPWKKHGVGSAKLESLAAHYGWFYDAHRADMDCHALAAVMGRHVGETKKTGWKLLLEAVEAPQYRLQATGAPFDAKDLLKVRGYRWDSVQRVWHTRLASEAELEEECAWLAAHVYANPRAQVGVAQVDALTRYSSRTPLAQVRPVAA